MRPVDRQPATLSGVRVDAIDEAGTIAFILDELAAARGGTVVTLNVDYVLRIQSDPDLADAAARARVAVADGRPLLWAARLAGTPLPGQVAGSSLVWTLSAAAAAADRRVFLLGGNPGTAAAAARALVDRYPALTIVGVDDREVDPADGPSMDRLIADLAAHRPDIVFSSLGAPKQELANQRLSEALHSTWFVGVGGAFSMVAGEVRRAPRWAQRAGIEWAYRLAQEPARLSRRYLLDDAPFAARLLTTALRRRLTAHDS